MRLINRLNMNWWAIAICIALAVGWRVVYRAIQMLFFKL